MSKKLTFLLALFAALATSVPSAFACSCMQQSPEENLARASSVFEGRVEKVEGEPGSGEDLKITLSLVRVWKGLENVEKVRVTTPNNSAACGVNFEPGKSYLVYANGGDKAALPSVSLCSRTQLIDGAAEDLAVLGTGVTPVQVENPKAQGESKGAGGEGAQAEGGAPQAGKSGCALAPGNANSSTATGLMLLLAGLWLTRRRRNHP